MVALIETLNIAAVATLLAMQWGQGRYDKVVAIFPLLLLTIVVIDHLSDRARARLVKGGSRDRPRHAAIRGGHRRFRLLYLAYAAMAPSASAPLSTASRC